MQFIGDPPCLLLPEVRPPLPPFTRESAIEKVRLAEDGWNSRDPQKVSLAYTLDTQWRNRAEFAHNREEAKAFLTRKWAKELDYRLIKELWAFTDNRIAVRYAYEWHDDSGNWFRSYGNENWEFDDQGLMYNRYACINDMPIKESERKFRWPLGRRPDDHPGLSELGVVTLSTDLPPSRASSLPHWILANTHGVSDMEPLWERACSRRRPCSRPGSPGRTPIRSVGAKLAREAA